MQARDGVPPRPPLAQLEALAAGQADLAAAWWITHQAYEHAFAEAAGIDPRTGAPVVQPLASLFAALRRAGEGAVRPFPADRVWRAAAFAGEPLARLLQQHRHRVVRSHAELPLHRVREVDARGVAWLAAQPGRTVREKLAVGQRMLAVQREQSSDTMENRMLAAFARRLAQRAELRLAQAGAYDSGAADEERRARLADMLDLCRQRFARSDLGGLAAERIRPNNVLLGDPAYSRVYRAWQWLSEEENALDAAWPAAMARARTALFWLVVARLAALPGVACAATFGRVRDGVGGAAPGIDVLGLDGGVPRWLADPELHLLTAAPGKPRLILRVSPKPDGLLVRYARYEGEGALRSPQGSGMRFSLHRSDGAPARGRGVPVHAAGGEFEADTFADLGGLAELATRIVAAVAAKCRLETRERPTGATPGEHGTGVAGLAMGSGAIVACDGAAQRLSSQPWAAAYALPEAGQALWLGGRAARGAGLCQPSVHSLDELVEGLPGADHAALAVAARHLAIAVAGELPAQAAQAPSWTMPDGGTAAAQRILRGAVQGALPHGVPVWRSVAAAMAWLEAHPGEVRPGDEVLVIDAEFSSATLTLLTARHDDELERQLPASTGLYWERRPPLPDSDDTGRLGWPHVLHVYARRLVARAAGAVLPGTRCDALATRLVHTGAIAALVAGGDHARLARAAGEADFDVLALAHDPAMFAGLVQEWMATLQQVAAEHTRRERGQPARRPVLVAGGPFDARRTCLGTVASKHPDKKFAFVRCDDGGERLFLHVTALAPAVLPEHGTRLEFDVGTNGQGRCAVRARAISEAESWCRTHLVPVTLEEVAAGARAVAIRRAAGCVSWKEWLPDLLLEVACAGHVVQVPLGERMLVEPVPGAAREFFAPARLALPAQRAACVLPVSEAGDSPRAAAWELHVQSNLLPLAQPLPVAAGVRHVYGADTSYALVLRPQAAAPFALLEARPPARMRRPAPPLAARCAAPGWDPRQAERFARDVGEFAAKGTSTLEEFLKRHRPEERSWAAGQALAAGRRLAAHLDTTRAADLADEIDRMAVRVALDGARPDDAARIAALDDAAAGTDAVLKLLRLLGLAVGDGSGWRADLLDRLLAHVARHGAYETFHPGLRAATVRALARGAWRVPALVAALSARPGIAAWLAADCMRSLGSMLARVPWEADAEVVGRVQVRYARPFTEACELLLALCTGATRDGPLEPGSDTAVALARVVRLLDARMHALAIQRNWWLTTAAQPPAGLARMSPLVHVLGEQLAPGTADGLLWLSE
jgi:cold shock CspA family protein